jgi:hypothetical protein
MSGISKVENGDRRVDVDDLTAIAYHLRTSPAALQTPTRTESPESSLSRLRSSKGLTSKARNTPPAGETTLTGVPEEMDKWTRGELTLPNDGLLVYWQQEWVNCLGRIQYFETILARPSPSKATEDPIQVIIKRHPPSLPRQQVDRPRPDPRSVLRINSCRR